jgi:hypothetical protein
MILHAYGCSWTEGQGVDGEQTYTDRDELKNYRNQYSWVNLLSKKLGLFHINNGLSGISNEKIFNKIVLDIRNGIINKNDFVAIMWTSTLRDNVSFLPNNEWVSWSVKELIETPERFINSYNSIDISYNKFIQNYKKFFITDILNFNYYNIVNQNYIIFIQKIFEFYGIKHLMIDGFDIMVNNPNKIDDKTHLINKNNYWGFGIKTSRELINESSLENRWEVILPPEVAPHPNKIGYELISEELYNYIKKNKLL